MFDLFLTPRFNIITKTRWKGIFTILKAEALYDKRWAECLDVEPKDSINAIMEVD